MAELKYIPAPEKPPNFDAELLAICGICPNNIDPYLRFSWGMDVTEEWGAEGKVNRYPDTNEPPKYVGTPFWILEGWQSPDVYDRLQWEANRDILGEFPTSGVWDFIDVLRDAEGNYIPLGEHALEMARNWKFWKSKPRERAIADLMDARARRAMLKESRTASREADIIDRHIERYTEALSGTAHTRHSVSGFKQSNGLFIPKNI